MIIKKVLVEWCEVTTCAGVLDIIRAKSIFAKLCWITVVSVGLSLTIWQTYEMLRDFIFDYPYQTTVSLGSGENIPFPNITICNFNRINKLKIGPIDNDALSYAFSSSLLPYIFQFSIPSLNADISKYEEAWLRMSQELNVTNTVQLYKIYGHSCEETFLGCFFDNSYFNCCDLVYESITPLGKCFTITSQLYNITQIIPGMIKGVYS